MVGEIEQEIEKLKLKKIELLGKLNITSDFDEKEEYEREIERINRQIKLLESLSS
jgi:hypothetical protein